MGGRAGESVRAGEVKDTMAARGGGCWGALAVARRQGWDGDVAEDIGPNRFGVPRPLKRERSYSAKGNRQHQQEEQAMNTGQSFSSHPPSIRSAVVVVVALVALGGFRPAPTGGARAECLHTWQDWSRPKWFFFKEWVHGTAVDGPSIRSAEWKLRKRNISAHSPGHWNFEWGKTLRSHSSCDPDGDDREQQ